MIEKVEFAVLGAGAMGSIIGAHLASSGRSVVMLATQRRATHLEQHGLRIRGLIELTQPVTVLSDASQLSGAGVLIVATKARGTEAALAPLRHANIDAVFSIQNGLMKNHILANAFGKSRVLGALANTSGEVLTSGDVLFTRNATLFIGELDGGKSNRAKHIATAIDASGIRASAVADIVSLEWSKFAAWAGMMVLSVTTRAATWKYLTDSALALVLTRVVREVGVLADACGIQLSDRVTLPVATICQGSEQEAVAIINQLGLEMMSNAPSHRMSALQDLESGNPMEIEETLAYAAREAARLGIALPLLDSFFHLATGINRVR